MPIVKILSNSFISRYILYINILIEGMPFFCVITAPYLMFRAMLSIKKIRFYLFAKILTTSCILPYLMEIGMGTKLCSKMILDGRISINGV